MTNWGFSQSSLIISEIMYNPPEAGADSTEFIEIYNNSTTTIDLTDYTCTGGVYTFPAVSLPAGAYYVITNNSSAFTNVFGFAPDGVFTNGLSNNGESIVLKDNMGTVIDSVYYSETAPWPATGPADGGGASLELCNPNSDNNNGASWNISTTPVGIIVNTFEIFASPGAANFCCTVMTSSQTLTECSGFSIAVGTNTYSATGNYVDTLSASSGCDSIVNTNLTINTVNTSVTQAENLLTADEMGATYQWLNCPAMTAIGGATSQSYTALANGDYSVIVTSNGCADTSSCSTVSTIGIVENDFGLGLAIYPNPTKDLVTVQLKSKANSMHYSLLTADGRTVVEGSQNNVFSISFDVSQEGNGIYFLHVNVDGNSIVVKVLKQ